MLIGALVPNKAAAPTKKFLGAFLMNSYREAHAPAISRTTF